MIPWNIIVKDFKLEITEEEHELLNNWLLKSSSKQLYELLHNLWYLILKQRIKDEKLYNNTNELWNKLNARINGNKFKRRGQYLLHSRHLWWIAAAVLLFVTMGSIWYIWNAVRNKNNMLGLKYTYETYSGKSRIILPDSTVVWLKNGTKLSYEIKNTYHKERYAKLDGEAFLM